MKKYINLRFLNDAIEKAYKKSCYGDWSCLDDINQLNLVRDGGVLP